MVKKVLLGLSVSLSLQGAYESTGPRLRMPRKEQATKEWIKQPHDENRKNLAKNYGQKKMPVLIQAPIESLPDKQVNLEISLKRIKGYIEARKEYRKREDGDGIIDMSVPWPLGCICLLPYLCGKTCAELIGYQFIPQDLYTDEDLLKLIQMEKHQYKQRTL